jgi:vancomycin resistance protein YoaR
LDEEIDAYGGGLCGGSTALYQWAFLNQALEFEKRNHSKRYTSLYTATINGEKQSTPGIDSTIYSPSLDLTITNTASYPIIIVANYDGTYQWVEEIFTMSPRSTDQWTYGFVQSRPRSYTLSTADGQWRAVTGWCYEWEINGELSTRCYREVF